MQDKDKISLDEFSDLITGKKTKKKKVKKNKKLKFCFNSELTTK